MQFSDIAARFDVATNPLYRLREQLLQNKTAITDLISGNVTAGGICFPTSIMTAALRSAAASTGIYAPDPLGQLPARKAIADYYRNEGWEVSPAHIVLTPGTSVSYWYVFKVIANAGDELLVPSPSYPLFDTIADLCQVKLVSYPLREQGRWAIDFDAMEGRISRRTRAIVLISPHNPTGAVANPEEIQRLVTLAKKHSLAIISDEVFAPFLFTGQPLSRPGAGDSPLVFTLNGFSKMLALPGFKIGWIVITGRAALVEKSLKALEMISDTFLPVSEISQAAAPALLHNSGPFQRKYVAEIHKRRDLLINHLGIRPPEGGFLALLPIHEEEETAAYRLLNELYILVHPGYFYDIPGQHLVLSFTSEPTTLKKALPTIRAAIDRTL